MSTTATLIDGTTWLVSREETGGTVTKMRVACAPGASDETNAIAIFEAIVDASPQPVEPRAQLLAEALEQINARHGEFLWRLTGDATTEERDTWPVKAEAARAYLAATASMAQTDMIETEAQGRAETATELATLITTKADAFIAFIGIAGELRGEGIAAVTAAAAPAIDDADVADEIAAAMAQFSADMAAAFAAATPA